MNSLTSSIILLVLALVLLWLAVTDRLSRLLDAVDVLRGNATANTKTASATPAIGASDGKNTVVLSLPSLPTLGQSTQVPV